MYIHKAVKRYIVTISSRVRHLLPDFGLLFFSAGSSSLHENMDLKIPFNISEKQDRISPGCKKRPAGIRP